MPLDVLGYSERGMVNALVYEMKYSEDGLERLRHVLGLCVFDPPRQWSPLKHAKIYIEQSFSGFGDLDLLILFQEQTDKNHALFLEAKVKTAGRVRWNIGDEWQKFKDLAADRLSDSNLFIQLYRKVQLARRLREGRQQLPEADDLSLGSNPVVRRATEDLAAYCGNAWFVALVPDSPENLQQFFQDTVRLFRPVEAGLDLPDWDANGWGYTLREQNWLIFKGLKVER